MLGFQYITSFLGSRFHSRVGWIFESPPLVIAFRGARLEKVMKAHRISSVDLAAALRQHGVLNLCQVECAIIEPNGSVSVFRDSDLEDTEVVPEVLLAVPVSRILCNKSSHDGQGGGCRGSTEEEAGQI